MLAHRRGVLTPATRGSVGLHLMGLISDGGVHSQLTHLFALLKLAAEKGLKKVYIHAILDGRDTPPDAGVEYIRQLQKYLDNNNTGRIATICGRFYAMDRDTRWDRTEKAFQLYTEGKGLLEKDPAIAVLNAYKRGETDEFIKPIIIRPEGVIKDHDSVVFFNFRADRARQITHAFTDPKFQEFHRQLSPALSKYVCMTVYDELFSLPVAFPPQHLKGILGEVGEFMLIISRNVLTSRFLLMRRSFFMCILSIPITLNAFPCINRNQHVLLLY